jgi:hypothetical protein
MTTMNQSIKRFAHLAALALLSLAACEGNTSATALSYVDPAGGDYQLKRNAVLSTDKHLVLDLWGPAATGSGVSVALNADSFGTSWANVAAADPAETLVQNGTQFQLGAAPQIVKATVSGGLLKATVAQKGTGHPVSLNGPLLRVALDLKPLLAAGTTIPLTADAARCRVLDAAGAVTPITISVGTLTATR